ncbi:hypothetical protein [Luteimonas deserti]|uniref:Uncharacterized protein n=1 Tax=Luteimonas deserti TaxID=2752306 RepID=A0A7Z0QQ20_9GAMM|nr:hypothetical protein [Luteimonas deserti]NYZ61727.1 hypothetical protein [Luteimonas deserti]
MPIRLPLILAAALLLSACGNKADLLQPSQVPPEDRGRFLIKSSIPTREQREAAEDAAWDDADEDEAETTDDGDADTPAVTPVPMIRDVPAATGTP